MGESEEGMKVNLRVGESKKRMRLDKIPYRHGWLGILQCSEQVPPESIRQVLRLRGSKQHFLRIPQPENG